MVVVRETILILFAAIKTVVDLQGFIAGSGGNFLTRWTGTRPVTLVAMKHFIFRGNARSICSSGKCCLAVIECEYKSPVSTVTRAKL